MFHLAQLNTGFVWRLHGDQPDYAASPEYDPFMIVTLSLWESLEALRAFVYHGDHGAAFRRRSDWFEPRPGQPNVVLWWVKAGERPTVSQAMARLKYLELHGPTAKAFTFAKPFPAPG